MGDSEEPKRLRPADIPKLPCFPVITAVGGLLIGVAIGVAVGMGPAASCPSLQSKGMLARLATTPEIRTDLDPGN